MNKTDLTVSGGGKTYEVLVDEDGRFAFYSDSIYHRADTLEGLRKLARRLKAKFELPFTRVNAEGVRNGTVTGIHASNSNLLVRWDDGSTEQIYGYSSSSGDMPQLSHADFAAAVELLRARNEAVDRFDAFVRDHGTWKSLKQAALEAQDKAVNG